MAKRSSVPLEIAHNVNDSKSKLAEIESMNVVNQWVCLWKMVKYS